MKVPVIVTSPPPEFGELKSSAAFADPRGMDRDMSYVPGLSEQRRIRDQQILEVSQGRRSGKDVITLQNNGRWVRCQNRGGQPDSRKIISAQNRGYRLVTKDMVGTGKPVEALPAGAEWHADGSVRQGDTILMVADAERVARNELQKRIKTESRLRGAQAGFEAAIREAGVRDTSAVAPEIKQEPSARVRAVLDPKGK